jgi:polysaccharide export outer membrane protein
MKHAVISLITAMLLIAASLVQSAAAQSVPGQPAAPTAAPTAVPGAAQNAASQRLVRLGPGDSVSIEVYGQPDMTSTVYVGDDGSISVPLVGKVQVAGLSPIEAAQKMEKALRDGGYFVDPHVNINVVQSRSQRVSVLGEVGTPGRYPIDPNTTVFDLLAQAGGITQFGADQGYVTRRDAQGNAVRYPVDLRQLPGKTGRTQSFTLQGGDELFVPHYDQFYIYGEVTTPNMYQLQPGMTVIQAIARAGGITPRGSEHRVQIKRTKSDGTFTIVRAKPNDLVQPNDVVYVKESIF